MSFWFPFIATTTKKGILEKWADPNVMLHRYVQTYDLKKHFKHSATQSSKGVALAIVDIDIVLNRGTPIHLFSKVQVALEDADGCQPQRSRL